MTADVATTLIQAVRIETRNECGRARFRHHRIFVTVLLPDGERLSGKLVSQSCGAERALGHILPLFRGSGFDSHRRTTMVAAARVWASLDIPVLALFGEFDIRTLPMDHEHIAAIVNARHPGKASWQILPKLDHGFAVHETLQDSLVHEFVGPFGEQVVQRTVEWMQLQ